MQSGFQHLHTVSGGKHTEKSVASPSHKGWLRTAATAATVEETSLTQFCIQYTAGQPHVQRAKSLLAANK